MLKNLHYAIPVENSQRVLKVMVYSDDQTVRNSVQTGLGRKPAECISDVEIFEVATEPAVIKAIDSRAFDLIILDGEAVPAGGMGIARQLQDEVFNCPPILVILGRQADQWLATWSGANAVIAHPIDPRALVKAAIELLDSRTSVTK
jgi:DNA-binding response OmpR family regulator